MFTTDNWVGFDIETGGMRPEYGLQAWRVKDRQAWLRSWAVSDGTGHFVTAASISHRRNCQALRRLLADWIDRGTTVAAWNASFDLAWLAAHDCADLLPGVKWLDAMLLWRHLENMPEYEVSTTKRRTFGLKAAVAEFFPDFAGYDEGVQFDGPILPLMHYNACDAIFTRALAKIFYKKLSDNPRQLRCALIEAHSLPLVGIADYTGLPVHEGHLKELDESLSETIEKLGEELAEHGATPEVLASPQQLGNLMFDDWGLAPVKHGKNGPSTDKETLVKLASVDPRARTVRSYREAMGNRTKFVTNVAESIKYNNDSRTHPQARVFGTYCVPGDVEVLTRDGWVRLDCWNGGDIVQAHPDLTMEFLPATRFVGPITADWVHAQKKSFDCMFTPGHTIPYLAQKTGRWRTTQAQQLLSGEQRNIPVAGHISLQGRITPDQMRLLVAVQADGYVTKKYTRFTLVKQRKVDRLRTLLAACGVQYRENRFPSYPDRVEITIAKSFRPDWLSLERKVFGPWVLDTTYEGLLAMVDEIRYWDGSTHVDGGGTKYTSIVQDNVQWAVAAAILVGKKAAEHAPYVKSGSSTIYSCLISKQRPVRSISPQHVRKVQQAQRAYCATTKTGFWLARSRGHIFITGNTGRLTYSSHQGKGKAQVQTGFALHQMKRDKLFRQLIKAMPGHTMVELDAAGQEFRWMAILSGDPTMLRLCLPGEDPHSYMGAGVAARDYREVIEGAHAEDPFLKRVRQMGKVANLSLQFRTSAETLCRTAIVQHGMEMDMGLAEKIHRTYRATYRMVPRYWDTQIAKIKSQLWVQTLAGRRVSVSPEMVRRYGWSVESTSINFPVQGTGGDQKYLALSVIRPVLASTGARFAIDLHDGLYFMVPDESLNNFIELARELFDNLPYKKAWGLDVSIPLPWDVKVGKTWGDMIEIKKGDML